jgi:hypothetical protein
MPANTSTPPADQDPASPRNQRRGTRPPSSRAIHGLLDWIDEAHYSQRTWARNALFVMVALVVLLWIARMWIGLTE